MDSVHIFSPSKGGKPGEFGTQFKATDLVEKNILTHVTVLGLGLETEHMLFAGNKQIREKFTGAIFDLTQNLFNTNSHRRSYKHEEVMELKRFKKESLKNTNRHLDITENPNELWVELNGFLTALKSSMDSLAPCFIINSQLNHEKIQSTKFFV